jgi:hypothetical protein
VLKIEKDDDGEEIEREYPCRLQKQVNNARENIVKWTRQIKDGSATTEPGGAMHVSAAAAKKDFEAYVGETLGGKNAAEYLANLPDTDPDADPDSCPEGDDDDENTSPAEE